MTKADSENTLVAVRRTTLQGLRLLHAIEGKSMIAILDDMVQVRLALFESAVPETEKGDDAALANLYRTQRAHSIDATPRDQRCNPRAKKANPRALGANPRALRSTAETE